MPWKVSNMSELRWAFCHAVKVLKRPVAQVAREHGISRKTGYKWLGRFGEGTAAPPDVHCDVRGF